LAELLRSQNIDPDE